MTGEAVTGEVIEVIYLKLGLYDGLVNKRN